MRPSALARTALLYLTCAGAAMASVMVSSCVRPREPDTVTEFLERLRGAGLDWHVTPAMVGGGPEQGAYLCEQPRGWAELQFLGHWPDQADRWHGVVFMRPHEHHPLAGDISASRLVVGAVSLYGDPRMLEQIHRALAR
jgi:hypothetical protein